MLVFWWRAHNFILGTLILRSTHKSHKCILFCIQPAASSTTKVCTHRHDDFTAPAGMGFQEGWFQPLSGECQRCLRVSPALGGLALLRATWRWDPLGNKCDTCPINIDRGRLQLLLGCSARKCYEAAPTFELRLCLYYNHLQSLYCPNSWYGFLCGPLDWYELIWFDLIWFDLNWLINCIPSLCTHVRRSYKILLTLIQSQRAGSCTSLKMDVIIYVRVGVKSLISNIIIIQILLSYLIIICQKEA